MLDYKRHQDLVLSLRVPEHAAVGFVSIVEAIERCERTFEPQFTSFIDPETRVHGAKCFAQTDCICQYYGGYNDAEYQILGVFPSHMSPNADNFPIRAFEITYQAQFGLIEHKDVLGALMSLGLERKVVGDILLTEGKAHFFALAHLESYLMANLEKVKRQGVQIKAIPFSEVIVVPEKRREVSFSVSSLRLDAVVAHAFHLSRTQAVELIKQGFVKVDYMVVDKVDMPIAQQQMISVRRQGRLWVGDVLGVSKKGKLRLNGWMTTI